MAVEMVIVTILVLVPILFGIIGFGIVMSQQISLDNATREAARAAVVLGTGGRSCGEITTNVQNAFTAPGVDSNPTVTASTPGVNCASAPASDVPCDGSDAGDALTVHAEYVSRPLNTLNITIASEAVYQCEFS